MLEEIGKKISEEYKNRDYTQGWSFLYTGINSFKEEQKLLFVGLNPGGSEKDGPYYEILSACMDNDKGYNSYLDEDWDIPRPNPLQRQVQDLFKKLYDEASHSHSDFVTTYGANYEDLMRNCLSLNYVPFRSSNWSELTQKTGALAFSNHLWKNYILKKISPSTIVTMNQIAYTEIKKIFVSNGYSEKTASGRTEWGNTTYELTKFEREGCGSVFLARCPHLSRYKLFNNTNDKYSNFQKKFISFLADGLR